LSWHSLPSVIFLAILLWAACHTALRFLQHEKNIKQLNHFVAEHDIKIMDIDTPQAFTAGLLKPAIYVSQGLHNELSAIELAAVIEHEKAHQLRKDPAKQLLFSFCMYFLPAYMSKKLTADLYLASEQSADAYAAKRLNDKTLVASTLLRVAKLLKQKNVVTPYAGHCAFAADEIRHRIKYLLLADPAHKNLPYIGLILMVMSIFSTYLMSTDALHHFTELFFQH
jgi:Zn-dependent protease with chaperone function